MSLAIALLAGATVTAGVAELKRARSDFEHARAELALDGAATLAEETILQSRPADRFAWSESTAVGHFDVLAEAEAPKLSVAAAAAPDGPAWERMGVRDVGRFTARLSEIGDDGEGSDPEAALAAADPAPLWRTCGLSFVSPWGSASVPHLAAAAAPAHAQDTIHLGEVWRLRLSSAEGFTDDRIVRFTGDASRPAAIVERRFYRGVAKGDTCDALADAKPRA